METLLSKADKAPVPFSTQLEVVVEMQFCPVLDEYPGNTVRPDEADVRPWYRCHQKTESNDKNCHGLCTQDSRQKNGRWIGFA